MIRLVDVLLLRYAHVSISGHFVGRLYATDDGKEALTPQTLHVDAFLLEDVSSYAGPVKTLMGSGAID